MFEGSRILIADDEPSYLHIIARYLTSQGHVCDCVPDGASATLKLETNAYEVLISDIEMPGNNDLGLVRKAAELAPGMPVILVTGHPSVHTAVDSHALPVFAYLMKPVDFASLSAQVGRAIGQYRVYKAIRATESRMSAWAQELADLRESVQSFSTGFQETNIRGYVSMAFNTMVSALSDLKTLLDVTAFDHQDTAICRMDTCTLKRRYELIMEDAIEGLRNTKGTFKSKEIQELRRNLEHALADERRLSKSSGA